MTKDKCEICEKEKAIAWFKGKNVCKKCWRIYKYGDMQYYLERLKLKKSLEGGKKKNGTIHIKKTKETS